jgi:hypothetical protein
MSKVEVEGGAGARARTVGPSANPYVVVFGPAESGTRRLNLAQSFNPIGSITGVLSARRSSCRS